MAKDSKQAALQVIQQMPSGASMEDIIYRLYFLQQVNAGLREDDAEDHVPHEQVERELDEWLATAAQR